MVLYRVSHDNKAKGEKFLEYIPIQMRLSQIYQYVAHFSIEEPQRIEWGLQEGTETKWLDHED